MVINNKELSKRVYDRLQEKHIPYYNHQLPRKQQLAIINNLLNYFSRAIKEITKLNATLRTHVFYLCPDVYDIINRHNGKPMTMKTDSKQARDQFDNLVKNNNQDNPL